MRHVKEMHLRTSWIELPIDSFPSLADGIPFEEPPPPPPPPPPVEMPPIEIDADVPNDVKRAVESAIETQVNFGLLLQLRPDAPLGSMRRRETSCLLSLVGCTIAGEGDGGAGRLRLEVCCNDYVVCICTLRSKGSKGAATDLLILRARL